MLIKRLQKILPRQATNLYELNIDVDIIKNQVIKELYARTKDTPRQIAKRLKISEDLVQQVVNDLKKQELVAMVGGTGFGSDYQYSLYPKGAERARDLLERDGYYGVLPVSFEDYTNITKEVLELVKNASAINAELMEAKFANHLGYQDVLFQLGQAVCARKPAFVYGFPGNGKTFLCSSVVKLLPVMAIPYAVEVGGQLVRIFDPSCHKIYEEADMEGLDERWAIIHPPFITAAGELTLEDLEVKFNKRYECFDAPPQVKATGGVLLIDDLGRQRCSPEDIFNRFIVPLENKIDFLVMGGQRMEVFTDEIILFSTNLDPTKIADDAFLRRLPYKINVRNPKPDEFTQIWNAECYKLGMNCSEQTLEYLFGLYKKSNRGLRAVHPRDLLNIVRDRKKYLEDENLAVTQEEVQEAFDIYFVSDLTLVDQPLA